jgi:hypothetical protein
MVVIMQDFRLRATALKLPVVAAFSPIRTDTYQCSKLRCD